MKTFRKFVEEYKPINEANFNPVWWNSKSDNFKKRYIERHPNSIYAKKFGNGKLDKEIASKKYHDDAAKKRTERNVAGNKSWMNLLAKKGLEKDRKGGKPEEALTPRYRKNLIRGAEEVYGKDSKQAARARELWGEKTPKKAPKEQPANKWVDDAFDEANLHFKWQKAKNRMDYHGVDEFTIRDIIKSGNYEPEEIIDALISGSHDKIDNMRDSVKKQEENKTSSLDSVKEKYGKRYQNIEDFVSNYDVEQFSKAAADYAYDVADGPDDVENHFDDFDGEYSVNYKDLADKMKKKFGFTPDRNDIAAILGKVGGKVKLV